MKRITILTALILMLCGKTGAQVYDTLFWGDREPTFYYWDTNWVDHYADDSDPVDSVHWRMTYYWDCTCNLDAGKPEVARVCLTDTALRIIGVAAPVWLGVYEGTRPTTDTTILPEYFRLWTYDENEGEMVVRASARFDTFQPRYMVQPQTFWEDRFTPTGEHYYDTVWGGRHFVPIYEGYFEKPVTVYDSFYVSGTGWNNYRVAEYYIDIEYPPGSGYTFQSAVNVHYEHPVTYYYRSVPSYPGFFQVPPYYYEKNHFSNHLNYPQFDTNWRMIYWDDYGLFLWFFPIFDTSSGTTTVPSDPCNVPLNFRAGNLSSDNVTLIWSEGDASEWEVSVASANADPDSGMLTHCNNPYLSISSLDTGTRYAAWVRTVCSDDSVSQWSDSVQFYVPGIPGPPTESVATLDDRYTMLMPNPASGSVTLMSSFQLRKAEIYSMDGRLLVAQTTGGISATIDISTLPQGFYLVRVVTNHGSTIKHLVVK